MFKLSGTAEEKKKAAEAFREALLQLPQKIDVLESMEVGLNINPSETWDIVLTACVPTLADVATYAFHPAHIEAASIIAPLKEIRGCVDYEV